MTINFTRFFEQCFAEPALQPAGLLLAIMTVYWSLVMLGAADIELFDWNFEIGVDGDAGIFDAGLVPFRFLNLGSVPVMLWATVFAFAAWILSLLIHYRGPAQADGVVVAEAFGLATVVAKVVTNPLRPIFAITEPNLPETMIGRNCVISTLTANSQRGEAHFTTDGAPLILTVRTDGSELAKGDVATIIEYNQANHTYLVSGKNLGAD